MSESESPPDIRADVETIVRDEWGRVHSALIGYVRDFELAEDVLQDAIVAALRHWTENGIPRSPRAWLLQTARRKAIDRFRRSANFETKRDEYEVLLALDRQSRPDDVDETIPDERLGLIFTCCHPALAEKARVALTFADIGRPDDNRDRHCLPRLRGNHGATDRAGETQNQKRRHSLQCPRVQPVAGTAGLGSFGHLSDL